MLPTYGGMTSLYLNFLQLLIPYWKGLVASQVMCAPACFTRFSFILHAGKKIVTDFPRWSSSNPLAS